MPDPSREPSAAVPPAGVAPNFVASLNHLVASAQPAVVFSSLAALSVAGFADACEVVITETADLTYRIQRPLGRVSVPLRTLIATHAPASGPAATDTADAAAQTVIARTVSMTAQSVRTPIAGAAGAGKPAFTGVVVHYWLDGYRPTALDAALARFAVDAAVTAVAGEREVSALDGPPARSTAAAGHGDQEVPRVLVDADR